MSGVEQLKEQLQEMGEALRAFDDPLVDQMPGLRLMHESLREREGHIRRQIEKNETCSVTVTLHGAAPDGPALSSSTLLAVLAPVSAAVRAATADHAQQWSAVPSDAVVAEAGELHLFELSFDGADATLLLTRRPGRLAAQVRDLETMAPAIEHGIATVTAALGGADVPAPIADPVRDLAMWVIDTGCVVGWSFEPYVLQAVEATLDRVTAQRLLEAFAGD